MILVYGGAYQGKLEYAKKLERDKGRTATVISCRSDQQGIDFSGGIIYGVEEFVRACIASGEDAVEFFRKNRDKWRDRVVIIRDVSMGIVPVDDKERAFREMNGRLAVYLAGEAEEVHRVFCGIGKRYK